MNVRPRITPARHQRAIGVVSPSGAPCNSPGSPSLRHPPTTCPGHHLLRLHRLACRRPCRRHRRRRQVLLRCHPTRLHRPHLHLCHLHRRRRRRSLRRHRFRHRHRRCHLRRPCHRFRHRPPGRRPPSPLLRAWADRRCSRSRCSSCFSACSAACCSAASAAACSAARSGHCSRARSCSPPPTTTTPAPPPAPPLPLLPPPLRTRGAAPKRGTPHALSSAR